MSTIKCIGILTSGGDAPGMNAAIRAVTRSAIYNGMRVKGIFRGYRGLITGEIEEFKTQNVSNIIQRGGTILKTARCLEFKTPEGRKQAYDKLMEEGIDALIAIGGDGTLTGARIFAQEFNYPIVGVPGTIDNDLYGTDVTIGYDTALNTIMECVDKIRDTAIQQSINGCNSHAGSQNTVLGSRRSATLQVSEDRYTDIKLRIFSFHTFGHSHGTAGYFTFCNQYDTTVLRFTETVFDHFCQLVFFHRICSVLKSDQK